MASSLPIKSQRSTSLTTIINEYRPDVQQETQHASNISTSNALFEHFLGSSEPENQQKALDFFTQVLDIGINFKSQPEVRHSQVENPATQSFGPMPEDGMSCKELLECFHKIAQHSTNFASPKFMGFPDAANSIPALASAILVPFINQNMCNQDIQAPAASFVEMEVVHWLRHQLGFQVPSEYTTVTEIGGIMTAGGCLSNTVGMMAARESLFPGSGMTGLPVVASKIRVLVPDVIE